MYSQNGFQLGWTMYSSLDMYWLTNEEILDLLRKEINCCVCFTNLESALLMHFYSALHVLLVVSSTFPVYVLSDVIQLQKYTSFLV